MNTLRIAVTAILVLSGLMVLRGCTQSYEQVAQREIVFPEDGMYNVTIEKWDGKKCIWRVNCKQLKIVNLKQNDSK